MYDLQNIIIQTGCCFFAMPQVPILAPRFGQGIASQSCRRRVEIFNLAFCIHNDHGFPQRFQNCLGTITLGFQFEHMLAALPIEPGNTADAGQQLSPVKRFCDKIIDPHLQTP